MKKKFNIGLLLCMFISLLISACDQESYPSDEYLVNEHKEKKGVLDDIVSKFLSEKIYRFEVLSNDEIIVRPLFLDLSQTDITKLEKQLKGDLGISLVDVRRIIKPNSEGVKLVNEVIFYYYRRGFVFAGESKGLAFVRNDNPNEIVSKIDRAHRSIHGKELYKKIAPRWYIYYRYTP